MAANDIANMQGKHTGATIAGDWIAVAPSDTTVLATTPRAIKVEGAGTVVIESLNGNIMHYSPTTTGPSVIPCAPKRIRATGTNAINNAYTTTYTEVYALY